MPTPDVPLVGIDHVHLVVGNARQSAFFYRNAFGFDVVGYMGLETQVRDTAGYVLRQGEITFVVTSPLTAEHPDNARLVAHGDSVRTIAFEVQSVPLAYEAAVARGAIGVVEPSVREDEHGSYAYAEIMAYGDVRYGFVDRTEYRGVFAPGFRPIEPGRYAPESFRPVGLRVIDHIVANVEQGQMEHWVRWHEQVLGFSLFASFDDKDISTEYSALMSRVVADGRRRIKLPINEPATGRRRSQIAEYLQFHHGPGVQHVAMATRDIVASVRAMRANDVSFLTVPPAYYDDLTARVGPIREDLGALRELGILVDRDEEGYLLQIFTKPVEDRPTLFFEIIQRRGAQSFGKGNFKALFEAIEREQARRGTL
ncbi:MAG: 4-hydroxyphenylpyruvate dioxygenase [Isosphaeraceae bacterium]|nr:MAG: 4-hydroxyphenylpyruvate dioxygenase [Isosphaeraceae bacterium]